MAEKNLSIQQVTTAPPLTVENVMTVVRSVRNWKTFAKQLVNTEDDDDLYDHYVDLDNLQHRYSSDEDCLKTVVDNLLRGDGPYTAHLSWRFVLWCLVKANETQLALHFKSYSEQLEDPTLTVDVLVDVMEKLTSDEGRRMKVWQEVLKWEYATPSSYMYEVYTQLNTSAREKTQALSDVYVNIRPESSWQHLVGTLYRQSELAAAKQAKPFLQHVIDPILTVDALVEVMEKLTSDEERRWKVWQRVLEWEYGTPSSYINEVYTQPNTSAREKAQALSDVYVNIRPESSWQHLVGTLYHQSELAAAKQAKSFLPVNDPTLTVDVLVDVMEKLTSDEERRRKVWRRVLRWENATPSSYIDEVYTQLNTSAREKTQTLSDVYVNITPESSWQHLVRILYGQSELAAAKQAKSYLPVNETTFTVQNVTAVMEKVLVESREEVWWQLLENDIVDETFASHSNDSEVLQSCCDTYTNCKPDSCWEELASCLYEEDQVTAVDQTRPFLPPRDLTVTTDRLMDLFQSVEDPDSTGWNGRSIGERLGLPQSAIGEIKTSYQSAARRKEAYLDTYANQHPWPSWKKVVGVLQRCDLDQQSSDVENTYVQVSERTQHDFDIAMMEGSLSIRNGNVFFLGSGGSGKSHTLAAILDEDPPSLRQSTPCVQKSIRTMAQCKVGVSGARFVRIKDDEYSDMLTTTAKQCQPAPSAAAATTAVSTLPPTAEELQIAVSRNDPVSSEDADKSTAKQESSGDDAPKKKTKRHKSGFEMELLRRMQALPKAPVDLYDKDLVDMRDSGGQTSFHEVLPIFVKNTTFGILTVKLNESLKAHPMVEYYTDGKPIGDPFKSHFTHLQTFRHCMRVLQSTCDSKSCPKLVFVGTHKDLEHECKPKESRQLKNAELRKIIPPAVKDSIIYCGDSLEELIHAVNVKNPGDEDREVISRLRELMIKELEKIPKKKIPLRYVALENAFLRQAKYKGKAVLSKEECFEIAKAFHFTRESLEAALEYLHSLKLIFYYKEVLPDVVFIDVQALLDKITELVKFCLSKSSRKITITGSVEEFVAYGIVTLELLSQFQSHYVPKVFTEKELILVFKYLRILAEVGQGKYLVPCLLKLGDILRPTALVAVNTIPALLFYFGPDGPKLGVYCCLVASLITDAKWELMTENDRPIQLSRNQVQFVLPGDDPGAITITDPFSSYFHVSVDFPKHVSAEKAAEICGKICSSIRETILAGIRKASRSLNYNNSIPKIAFPCSVHEDTELHPAVVSDSGLLTCTAYRSSACSEITKQHKLWLGAADTGSAPTQAHQAARAVSALSVASPIDARPSLAKLSVLRTAKGKKIQIIKRLAPNWRNVGILLDFDQSGTELDIIEKTHPTDLIACSQAMFQHWLKGNGLTPCSWRTLIEVLGDCDQQALAKEIQDAIAS